MSISKEVKVAVLAIVAIVILFFGIRFLKGSELLDRFSTYYVLYDEIDGLIPSNPVIINGLKVGRVESIKLMQENNNRLLVGLRIREDVVIGKSSQAILASSSLLGGETIILKPGDVRERLQDGDTIQSNTEQTIGELVQAKALPIAEKFDSTLARFNTLIGVNGKDTMANILGMLLGDTATVSQTVDEIAIATQRASLLLRYNEQKLNTTIANLAMLSNALSDQKNGLPPLLTKMNRTLDSINSLQVGRTVNELNRTLDNMNKITAKIDRGDGTLGKFVNDDSLYTNLNQSAEALERLLVDLEDRPGRYVRFSVFGGRDKDKDANNETEAVNNDSSNGQ